MGQSVFVNRSTARICATLQTHPQRVIVFEIGWFQFGCTIWHLRALNALLVLDARRFECFAQFLSVNRALDVCTIRRPAAIIFLIIIG